MGRGFSRDQQRAVFLWAKLQAIIEGGAVLRGVASAMPSRAAIHGASAPGQPRPDLRNDISTELDDVAGAAGAGVLGISRGAYDVAG